MLLLAASRRQEILDILLARVEHVELAANPAFQDAFIDCMPFPS